MVPEAAATVAAATEAANGAEAAAAATDRPPRARWPRWRPRRAEAVPAALAAAVIAALSAYRIGAVGAARYPGHADPAFYYNTAQNIRDGHGPTINYIWEFLSGQPSLPRYAFDYWMPLPSMLMSVALHVHNDLSTALCVNIAMSIVLALGTYLLTRGLTDAPWAPALASVLALVQPAVSTFSVQSEAAMYLAAFSVLAMAAVVGARRRPWLWPLAGALAGLANMSRNEGMLLAVVVLVAAAAGARAGRRLLTAGTTLAGYVVAMLPLFVMNVQHLGTLMPSSSGAFPFITRYEDLFALRINRTPSAFFGGGFIHLRSAALDDQFKTALRSFYGLDGFLVIVLVGAAAVPMLDRAQNWGWTRAVRAPWFVPVAFAVATFGLYALVTPVVASAGALQKGMVTIVAVLCVGAAVGLTRVRSRAAVALVAAVLLLAPVSTLASVTRSTIRTNNAAGRPYAALIPRLQAEQKCLAGQPLVMMTRNPWEFTQITGYQSVQIPNASLPDILAVARRYHVTDINLNVARSALSDRTALVAPDGPFTHSQPFAGHLIYRMRDLRQPAIC